jgi:predicted DCC family thiol-disulfide oxidoreductase YuxK
MPELLFYDGHCGLCHRAVRFVTWADPAGRAFRFAPLDGETIRATVPEAARRALPDSVVVRTGDGRLLVKWRAVVHVLRRLGGPWPVLGLLAMAVPRPLGDRLYDAVARVRARLFAPPPEACPLVPPGQRARFDP